MDDDLPLDYDVIVVGTGMTESIVAAAASRIGKKTLHIDSTDYYGGMWASFNFDGIQKLITDAKEQSKKQFQLQNIVQEWFFPHSSEQEACVSTKIAESDGNDAIENTETVKNSEEKVSSSTNLENEDENQQTESKMLWTMENIKKEYRKFNIDLAPKLLYARGSLVELLISSNIARYAEFRCINRVMTWMHDKPVPVPCSRADVFSTADVSVVEKRMLMKLLTSFVNYDEEATNEEFTEFAKKSFMEYLKSKKLTDNLMHYVLYAIAGGTATTSCIDGVQRCKRFLTSLGRYGNTPFLWPMYGSGELPQCFCRLCAVFGGIYCLNRPIGKIEIKDGGQGDERLISIESRGKLLKCDNLVIAVDKVPDEYLDTSDTIAAGLSRAVFITDSSILDFDKESLTLLQFPPMEGHKDPITVIELGPSTGSCPDGLYVVHMIGAQTNSAKEDIFPYAKKLMTFESNSAENGGRQKPQVLWSLYFNIPDTSHASFCKSKNKNIHICSGPDIDLDFEFAVKQGHETFRKIYPEEEFLPRAPDPEEIVFEDENETGPEFETDATTIEAVTEESGITDIKENDEDIPEINENLQN